MRLFLLGLTGALPFLACVALFLFARASGPLALRIARGIGWCVACALPAVLVQDALLLFGGSSTRFSWSHCAQAWPFQVWVLSGGGVVQRVFESTAKDISGHRQSTMMDNWLIYVGFTLLWLLPWGALIAGRLRKGPLHRDPVAWFVALVVLANALEGALWPWWGT